MMIFQLGVNNFGISVIKYGDFVYDGETSKFAAVTNADGSSQYYLCTPDLSGFNADCTYYVSYSDIDNVNTLKILNKINEVYTYTNAWYDYTAKNWANVLTINNKIMAYWVWIPRFAYNTAEFTEENVLINEEKDLEVRLVDMENQYYDEASGTMKALEEGWVVPDAFNFDGEARGGYWMSKYEVQEYSGNSGTFYITASTDTISVRASDSTNKETYTVYIDGEENVAYKGAVDSNQCNLTKANGVALTEGTSYLITICDNDGVRQWVQSVSTLTTQDADEITNNLTVDVSTFWDDATLAAKSYFVLYDKDGKNPVLVPFNTAVDKSAWSQSVVDTYLTSKATGNSKYWYNYGDKGKSIAKIWANIVTINNNTITYWTYIPRYAYYQVGHSESWAFDIRFVGTSITNNNLGTDLAGYTVPDSFTFDNHELYGYWMSKYEVQADESHADYIVVVDGNKIKILNQYANAETTAGSLFTVEITDENGKVYVDGSVRHKDSFITGSDTADNKESLAMNTEYNVNIYTNLKTSTGDYVKVLSYSEKVKTPESSSGVENIKIDVSGFDPDNTLIVLYNGTTQVADSSNTFKLSTLMADTSNWSGGSFNSDGVFEATSGTVKYKNYTWFDYSNKIWANVRTIANGTNTYFTYIPRYEIKIDSETASNTVKFLKKDDAVDSGYILPDAFTFGMESANKDLYGFWMSKYEVQDVDR